MVGERRRIESPLWIDLSKSAVPRLAFLLQQHHVPTGIVVRPSSAITIGHTPWYSEVTVELSGVDGVAVLYVIQKDDEWALLVGCLGEAFEPFFELATGADFGDEVTKLMALHWPEVYAMLNSSSDPKASGRVLCNVATPGHVQWAVADHVEAAKVEQISAAQILELLGVSLRTLQRVANLATELPGLIHVLGGPDRMTRRLNTIAALLGASGDITSAFQGGVRPAELVGVAKAAREALGSVRDLAAELA